MITTVGLHVFDLLLDERANRLLALLFADVANVVVDETLEQPFRVLEYGASRD